jgi:nucleoside-diphosphate-sugar epimerase
MKRILITGAAGAIGKVLRAACGGKYRLRLSDIEPLSGDTGKIN